MDNTKTIEIFKQHFRDKGLFEDLDEYLKQKEIYMQDRENIQKTVDMKNAYDLVYTDMKYWLSAGIITYNVFWELVDVLQEGF